MRSCEAGEPANRRIALRRGGPRARRGRCSAVRSLRQRRGAVGRSARARRRAMRTGPCSDEIVTTLEVYVQGLALALGIGLALGIAIGISRTIDEGTSVVVEFLRPIPAVALIPLAILWFGLGTPMLRFAVAYAAVWPILIHTVYGIRGVDRMLYDVAATSGVTGLARVVRVSVPAALPGIATGIRVGAAIALVVCVTARVLLRHPGHRRVHAGAAGCLSDSGAVCRRPPRGAHRAGNRCRAEQHRATGAVLGRRGAGATPVSARSVAAFRWLPPRRRGLRRRARDLGGLGPQRGLLLPSCHRGPAARPGTSGRARDFLSAAGASLKRLAAGFAIGSTVAVAVGLAMGSSRRVRSTLGPTAEFLRVLPVVAIVPIAIVLLGVGDAMRIGVIAFGVFFPVLVATVDGSARECRQRYGTPPRCFGWAGPSGAFASTCLLLFRRSSPASARRSRSGSCSS